MTFRLRLNLYKTTHVINTAEIYACPQYNHIIITNRPLTDLTLWLHSHLFWCNFPSISVFSAVNKAVCAKEVQGFTQGYDGIYLKEEVCLQRWTHLSFADVRRVFKPIPVLFGVTVCYIWLILYFFFDLYLICFLRLLFFSFWFVLFACMYSSFQSLFYLFHLCVSLSCIISLIVAYFFRFFHLMFVVFLFCLLLSFSLVNFFT